MVPARVVLTAHPASASEGTGQRSPEGDHYCQVRPSASSIGGYPASPEGQWRSMVASSFRLPLAPGLADLQRFAHIPSAGGTILAFLLAITQGGCATNGSQNGSPFRHVEIVALAPDQVTAALVSNEDSVVGGAAGGAFGGLMGSFFGSLACGPLFAACFAATAPLTIGATAVVGAAMVDSAPTVQDVEQVSVVLATLQQKRNLSEELAVAVSAQLPVSSLAPEEAADTRLGVRAKGIGVAQQLGQKFSLSVTAVARIDWDRDRPEPRHAMREYSCETGKLSVEEWLADDGGAFERELSGCVEELALELVKALNNPPAALPAGFGEGVT